MAINLYSVEYEISSLDYFIITFIPYDVDDYATQNNFNGFGEFFRKLDFKTFK